MSKYLAWSCWKSCTLLPTPLSQVHMAKRPFVTMTLPLPRQCPAHSPGDVKEGDKKPRWEHHPAEPVTRLPTPAGEGGSPRSLPAASLGCRGSGSCPSLSACCAWPGTLGWGPRHCHLHGGGGWRGCPLKLLPALDRDWVWASPALDGQEYCRLPRTEGTLREGDNAPNATCPVHARVLLPEMCCGVSCNPLLLPTEAPCVGKIPVLQRESWGCPCDCTRIG